METIKFYYAAENDIHTLSSFHLSKIIRQLPSLLTLTPHHVKISRAPYSPLFAAWMPAEEGFFPPIGMYINHPWTDFSIRQKNINLLAVDVLGIYIYFLYF